MHLMLVALCVVSLYAVLLYDGMHSIDIYQLSKSIAHEIKFGDIAVM